MTTKTIVWDVDDVLNDLMKVWLEDFWTPRHPGTAVTYAEIGDNPPEKLLGVSKREYLASLDQFRLSGAYDRLEPNVEIRKWFVSHGASCRHIALTRTPLATAHISAAWVLKHFGTWIRSFHLIPSPRPGENSPVYDNNKGAYLRYFGKADLLIDDAEDNARSAEKAGVAALLYPRPWNKSVMTVRELLDRIMEITDE